MASRDEYVAKIKGQLDDWNVEIGKLEEKLGNAGDETRKELQPYMIKAKEARDALVSKLNELKDSSEATWESSKDDVEHVWKTFKQSVNYFKSQL
jgi:predicted  nucleic acid-binding Zn-ribbon protein